MRTARPPVGRAYLFFILVLASALPALGAEKSRIKAQDYVIDAEIIPKTHHLTAHAKVKFTALDDVNFATFELNNALRPTRVLDEKGKVLTAERISQDNAVRVVFPAGLTKGSSTTLTFDYEVIFETSDDSPDLRSKLACRASD